MNEDKCLYFESCTAPLCPLQKDTLKHAIWFPDEEICWDDKYRSLPWIEKQKAIVKAGLAVTAGYFMVESLAALVKVTKATKGLNPDKTVKDDVDVTIPEPSYGKAFWLSDVQPDNYGDDIYFDSYGKAWGLDMAPGRLLLRQH